MHDSMVMTMEDGSKWRVEKNHVIEAKPITGQQRKTNAVKVQSTKVPVHKNMTAKQLIDNASAGDKEFWNYDPAGNNCQKFVEDVVSRNGLEPASKVVRQDAKALVGSLGALKDVPKLVTDLAAVGDRLIHGGSRQNKCSYCGKRGHNIRRHYK